MTMTNWDIYEFKSIGEAIDFIKAYEEDLENAEAESDRLRGLLKRVNEWAKEHGDCPICRSVSWDGDALMHAADCELAAECNEKP